MAAMVGNVPLAIRYGNGAGVPAVYVIASVMLLCFSVGYVAMSWRVVSTGAFCTYMARSLGRPAGVASAYVAVIYYTALTIGMVGVFGYLSGLVLASSGIDLPWYLNSAVALVLVADLWCCVIAPVICAVGLAAAFVPALLNYLTLTDSGNAGGQYRPVDTVRCGGRGRRHVAIAPSGDLCRWHSRRSVPAGTSLPRACDL